MVKNQDKKIDHIEKLVETIATTTLKLTEDVTELKFGVAKLEEKIDKDTKDVRADILNLGERFPSQSAFNELSMRVYTLEKKVLNKE